MTDDDWQQLLDSSPFDFLLRSSYADWLEEQGLEATAQYNRMVVCKRIYIRRDDSYIKVNPHSQLVWDAYCSENWFQVYWDKSMLGYKVHNWPIPRFSGKIFSTSTRRKLEDFVLGLWAYHCVTNTLSHETC